MARGQLNQVEEDVLDDIGIDDEIQEDEDATTPAYALIGDASIPVSRKAGDRWKAKVEDALASVEPEHAKWNNAYIEYRKVGDSDIKEQPDYKFHHEAETDENLVRENVKLLLRNTYTRNPKIELSTTDASRKPIAKSIELALYALMNRKTFPGLNAKARIRRGIVHAHLTNFGLLRLDYQPKVGSRQEALQELETTRRKLVDAKDTNKIEELYAELEQIEEMLPLTQAAGMKLSNTLPHRLIVDPKCTYADLSDADWVAEEFYLKTAYIKSKFLKKTEDGKWVRKSDDKEVSALGDDNNADAANVKERVADQVMGATTDERHELLRKGMTRCYMIWDKFTRERLLFMDDDWKYPLWVYPDELKLSRFFQHHIISYTEPVDGIIQPGETSQYHGQIRQINKINARVAFIRNLAFGTLIYNTKVVTADNATKLVAHMKNPTKFDAFGIPWDPESKLSEMFDVFVPPDAQLQQLYDKTDLMKTVDRTSATSSTQKGEQFKTNTTNDAIAAYSNTQATVTNELTDVVEDCVEELAWSMAEILVSKYTKEEVAALIGTEAAAAFEVMQVEEFNAKFGLTVAAGSTEKPTSENKKREAIQIAQAIGQVGQATPQTTMNIIMRMFQEAFSEFLVTDSDFELLKQEGMAALQKGVSAPPGAAGAPPQPPAA